MFRGRFASLALLVVALSGADARADDKVAEPAKVEVADEIGRTVRAAEEAAKAAKEAALAAKASTEALLAALEARPKAAEAKAAAPPVQTPWVYNLGVNLISVSGNANAVTAKALGQVTGKWGPWAATIKGSAAYGQTSVPNEAAPLVTGQNADVSLRGDRGFTEVFGAYVTGGGATDRVASIRLQTYGEAGVGITWFEEKDAGADWVRNRLRTDFGFRATHEARMKYFPEPDPASETARNIFSPRMTVAFKYALSKTAFFSQDAEILPDLQQNQNLRASAASLISAQIDKGIALNLGFKVRYIGQPAKDAKTTDTELGAGIGWTF